MQSAPGDSAELQGMLPSGITIEKSVEGKGKDIADGGASGGGGGGGAEPGICLMIESPFRILRVSKFTK